MTHKIYPLGETRSVDVNSIILYTYSKIMYRYLLEKDLIPEGQLVELPYEDFIKNPVTSMRAAYKTLHLNDFSCCEHKMTSFAQSQKKFKVLDRKLPPEERKTVSEKLKPIISYWNYPFL